MWLSRFAIALLCVVALVIAGFAVVMRLGGYAPLTGSGEPPVSRWKRKTYTYKVVDEIELSADVYRVENSQKQPAIVWIHSGGLITGSRHHVPPYLRSFCRQHGITVISIDYRLAPETKLPDIAEDVVDAYEWIKNLGPDLLAIDADRIAVIGHSAGGYLTLLLATHAGAGLKAIVVLSGYADLTGAWLTKPSPYHIKSRERLSRALVENAVGNSGLTNVPWGAGIREKRSRYYTFLRQTGAWPEDVVGFNPVTEYRRYLPYLPLLHINGSFPPALLLHGELDQDVPFEQGLAIAERVARQGVYHEFIRVPNAGHNLFDTDNIEVVSALQQIDRFLLEQLTRK